MNNELLKQVKDEVARTQLDLWDNPYESWDDFVTFNRHESNIWPQVAELYSSRQREELQERVERLASCLSRVLYWDNGDLPENAIRDIKSALSGEAQSKDESLEAYNRECKRVDELTEEVAKKQELILELEKELAQWRKGPHLTPDGAQSYIRCANERADKIAELEGLLKRLLSNRFAMEHVSDEFQNECKKSINL